MASRIIDLTISLEPTLRGVDIEFHTTVAKDGWLSRMLHLYSHCGTHMDAPTHFAAGTQTIDEIPVHRCMGRAWLVDVRHLQPRQEITVDHLGSVADSFVSDDAIIFWSDWTKHLGDPDYYRDQFSPISRSLARWMVDRKVRMVGVQPPSVADVNDLPAVTEIHKILLGAGIIIVEGLDNVDQIQTPTCHWIALPIKVAGGDGAPCRSIAIVGSPGVVGVAND